MPASPDKKPGIGVRRIVRAALIGAVLFGLWSLSPFFIYKMAGVNLDPPRVEEKPQPVRRDAQGKRISEPDYEIMQGYEKAKREKIASHAECKAMEKVYDRVGCHKYVTGQKTIPPHVKQGDWASGKTTAQCVAEVNAYYEVVIQDMREQGQDHAANSWTRRNWIPEREQCQNYDNLRISDVIHKPASRLQALIEKAESGARITEEERATVRKDLEGVTSFPEHRYRQEYLAKSEYFFGLADGKVKPPPKVQINLSCAEIQAKLDALEKAEQANIDAQNRLKQGDRVTDGEQWKALNQARIDRLWDWKRYTDAAKAGGCNVTQVR